MKCFVTVGTTRFDALIEQTISSKVFAALHNIGVDQLVMQIGDSPLPNYGEGRDAPAENAFQEIILDGVSIDVLWYRYKPSLAKDMEYAKVIVGHAGAGTCLECLRMRKPLIVVINALLMDNHQMELAGKLASLGHLMHTRCDAWDIAMRLADDKLFNLQPYNPPDMAKVAAFLDKKMLVK